MCTRTCIKVLNCVSHGREAALLYLSQSLKERDKEKEREREGKRERETGRERIYRGLFV